VSDEEVVMARIAEQVLAYVAVHRSASDTVSGIRRWWLTENAVPLGLVEEVLARLVDAGELVRSVGLDGIVRYAVRMK
jgi:hypothetical protein